MRGLWFFRFLTLLTVVGSNATVYAQSGGRGPGGGGGGAQAPPVDTRPKFRDHVHSLEGLAVRRETGDAVVAGVQITGNKRLSENEIAQSLQTRKGRFFDNDTVLGDIRRLNDLGAFDHVTFKVQEVNQGEMLVTFIVHERDVISKIHYHGKRAFGEKEYSGHSGLTVGDPLNEFSIESARRRLEDYLHEEGFNQGTVESTIGFNGDPNAVFFKINEGPLERIRKIRIHGATIVSEARLKKIISSRGPLGGVYRWATNAFDIQKVDRDVDTLASYYHTLGFLTATVGRQFEYDESGKWVTLDFFIDEGPRFTINEVKIIGNEFIKTESLRQRLQLKPGEMYNGTLLRADVTELVYGYGELGFLYAEVEPQTILRDGNNVVDLVYKITEGDRWKINKIRVNIDGDPNLMRETTLLNLIDLREGSYINRRDLELNRARLERGGLLEADPQVADPPDIRVIPIDETGPAY